MFNNSSFDSFDIILSVISFFLFPPQGPRGLLGPKGPQGASGPPVSATSPTPPHIHTAPTDLLFREQNPFLSPHRQPEQQDAANSVYRESHNPIYVYQAAYSTQGGACVTG